MSHENEAEIIVKAEVEKPAEPLCLLFKCDQWDYTNTTKRASFNTKGQSIGYPCVVRNVA